MAYNVHFANTLSPSVGTADAWPIALPGFALPTGFACGGAFRSKNGTSISRRRGYLRRRRHCEGGRAQSLVVQFGLHALSVDAMVVYAPCLVSIIVLCMDHMNGSPCPSPPVPWSDSWPPLYVARRRAGARPYGHPAMAPQAGRRPPRIARRRSRPQKTSGRRPWDSNPRLRRTTCRGPSAGQDTSCPGANNSSSHARRPGYLASSIAVPLFDR